MMSAIIRWCFLINCAVTWYLTGVIWFVQIVHYPLMDYVGVDPFQAYEAAHRDRVPWVVAIPMLTELGTAAVLALRSPTAFDKRWFEFGFYLALVQLLSTFLWQVPLHQQLQGGYDPNLVGQLVSSNWLRTIIWSARSVLLLRLLHQWLPPVPANTNRSN